ncbi:emp24/gp25L/p24 family protein [Alkalicoccus chagannorensis]|uniref:emp24/gp25L/p24 family protein n=1 Tax=Alkalicoccus chagannorensis TaxID=427072 RepID=UPI0003FB0811|nr:emp24/gp25L/p24 family protein [Alkalicoccus chagannorensis]
MSSGQQLADIKDVEQKIKEIEGELTNLKEEVQMRDTQAHQRMDELKRSIDSLKTDTRDIKQGMQAVLDKQDGFTDFLKGIVSRTFKWFFMTILAFVLVIGVLVNADLSHLFFILNFM